MSMFDTQPTNPSGIQPNPNKNPNSGRSSFWISLLVLFVVVILGSLSGYGLGIFQRVNAEKAQLQQQLDEQFALARQDIDEGRYEIARQRLEFMLQKNAAYPGIGDMLVEVQVKLSITPTLVPTSTPTMTPTPDLRSQEAIYAQAQQQMQNRDWSGALASIDALRKADPTYFTVQVDGMYYMALRNRGVDQINGSGSFQQTNMEGGIYDLTLAERFGPLDNEAESLRTGARMFVLASSFYGVDWVQAEQYFSEVYRLYPGLRDSTDVTVARRYREVLLNIGDLQAQAKKQSDSCRALESWSLANSISPLDNDYAYKFNALNLSCNPPTPTIDPALLITPTATTDPALIIPSATP